MKKRNFMLFVLLFVFIGSGLSVYSQTRIKFAKGRTSATVSGKLVANGERSYVLGAKYGQYLSANISSSNDCIVFSNGATNLSYTTESGDNYIYVINNCRKQVSFSLTVSINYGSD